MQTIHSGRIPPPVISVCIPSYNNGQFIARTCESVLNQTYGNFEIIVCDDHSSDNTVAVVKGISDPRIKLVENPVNLGMGENWNKALSYARGKYVKLLCGDDILYPDCLALQTRAMEDPANSGVVLAICGSDIINARDEFVLRRGARFARGRIEGGKLIRKCVRWGTNLIGEPAVGLFRRDILPKSGLFDPSNPYLIDLAFWSKLLKNGPAFGDATHLAAFRISRGSVSAQVGLSQAACFRRFVHNIYTDPTWRANRLDVILGGVLSFHWCLLRNLLINLQVRKNGAASIEGP